MKLTAYHRRDQYGAWRPKYGRLHSRALPPRYIDAGVKARPSCNSRSWLGATAVETCGERENFIMFL